ncbi:Claspin [Triplophysa tibetana]|uniref:Claspin n=1 Tax=Triplophysa tibetana TaxID=1572043 RepID=A0A5A9NQ11_9TELE|nr:Claspin [Triplophysa tibetana]
MGSPMEEPMTDTNLVIDDQQDSDDDDITVSRKGRLRKALRDSDSDGEQEEAGMANALVLSESSEEEKKTNETKSIKKKLGSRISRLSMESDESEPEKEDVQVKPKEAKKKRDKSHRRREKDKRNASLAKRLKDRTEDSPPPKALYDSGCLLGDSDLFDAQLDEDSEQHLEEEDEDSANESMRMIQRDEFSGGEEQENKPQRKERKSAKASKEALRQLYSDSQRLVRESVVGLPYHMPEPKSIDQFFRRRPRPEGPAMALLKSAKYQACILEASAAPPLDQNQANTSEHVPQQDTSLQTDSSVVTNQTFSTSLPSTDSTTSTHQEATTDREARTENDTSTNSPKPVVEEKDYAIDDAEHLDNAPQQMSTAEIQTEDFAQPSVTEPAPQVAKPRKDKLARLRELGLDPPPVAKLCADEGDFVHLEPPQENPALKALQERFLKHVQPVARPKGERTMQLSVVRKDNAPSGQQELHTESITITVNEEEDPAKAKPGEKLVVLKSRLQQAMAIRRKEERERRAALHRLDNEDCEEEEAEMTESEDEELSPSHEASVCSLFKGVDVLLGDNGAEEEDEAAEEEGEDQVSLKTCPSPGFKSPSPTPADTDGTLMLFAGNSCSRTGFSVYFTEEDDTLSMAKDSSHNSSFELMGSMIPSYQPVSRAGGRGLSTSAFRSPSPCLFRPSFLGSASKSSGKLSEPSLSLPVEDSQDLYAPSSPSESALPPAGDSQGRFSLEEDTHSQLLDADGFLNVGPRSLPRRSHKRQLILDSLDENAMDANMGELLGLCSEGFGSGKNQPGNSQPGAEDELLGLCSGAFTTQSEEPSVRPKTTNMALVPEKQRGGSHGSSDADMDQLLALCSGKFTGSPSSSSRLSVSSPAFEKPSEKRNKKIIEEEEEEEGDCEFHLLSDVDSFSGKEDNEEESDAEKEENENEEEEEEEEEREAVFGRRPGKKKMRLAQFVDSEAELSGSDLGSEDEDEEGGDEYEDEDIQEELPSDEELMDQVNKIHMKHVLDDDKRKLRLYQERYLADGDLHSDGPGRARQFRWKNLDDNFEFGGSDPNGDEEEEDEEIDQVELQRRKERLERDQWIREQNVAEAKKGEDMEDEEKIVDEDSQFMKLAKKVTAKTLQKRDTPVVLQEKAALNANQFRKPFDSTVVKRGSLLSQPRSMLQKLASISDSNPLAPRNSRGFLFQTLSPEKETPKSDGPKKQIKKRGQTDTLAPAAKRTCFGNPLKPAGPPRSIFSYLEN